MSVKPKVSSVVTYQLPEFIRRDHPNFSTFLEVYYASLEKEDAPLDVIRRAVDNTDVDVTSEQFLKFLKSTVLPYSVNNATGVIGDAQLIKFLRELYLAKGTEDSFKFVMNTFFNADIEMDYGKNHVFRTSDNEYRGRSFIVMANVPGYTYNLFALEGKRVYQFLTKSSATIDKISLYEKSVVVDTFTADFTADTNVLYNVSDTSQIVVGDIIIDNKDKFEKGLQVVSIDGDTIVLSGMIGYEGIGETLSNKNAYYICEIDTESVVDNFDIFKTLECFIGEDEWVVRIAPGVTTIDINDYGALYKKGQKVNVIGGSGYNAEVVVDEVSAGAVEGIMVVDPGTGYTRGEYINFAAINGEGSGALGIITEIDGYGAKISPIMEIDTVTINAAGQNYTVGEDITTDLVDDTGLPIPFTVVEVLPDPNPTSVNIVSGGHDYVYARAMFVGKDDYMDPTYTFTEPVVVGGVVTCVPVPTDFDWGDAPIDVTVNGSGGTGTINLNLGTVTFPVTVLTGGQNYVDPVVRIYEEVITGTPSTPPDLKWGWFYNDPMHNTGEEVLSLAIADMTLTQKIGTDIPSSTYQNWDEAGQFWYINPAWVNPEQGPVKLVAYDGWLEEKTPTSLVLKYRRRIACNISQKMVITSIDRSHPTGNVAASTVLEHWFTGPEAAGEYTVTLDLATFGYFIPGYDIRFLEFEMPDDSYNPLTDLEKLDQIVNGGLEITEISFYDGSGLIRPKFPITESITENPISSAAAELYKLKYGFTAGPDYYF